MSETFYMRTLRSFLDQVCLDNFGWFYSSLGRAWSSQYMNQWDIHSLAGSLMVGRTTVVSRVNFSHFVGQEVL